MPTYALLGATGSTGSAILRSLLSQPPHDLTLNVFVRSKLKLLNTFPQLEADTANAFNINIVEGVASDSSAMQQCLKDADVIMACIGTNYSTPGMTLIYDTAAAIVDALRLHQKAQDSKYKPPVIIQLRSASLNPVLKAAMPWIAQTMASFCFYHVYQDLERACKLFSSAAEDSPQILDYICVDPPSIHDPDGTTPTGFELILDGKQEPALSYADLGAAFCELAERRDEFVGKGVGVTATGTVNQTVGTLFWYVVAGAKSRIWG